jgi:hypothetical protein
MLRPSASAVALLVCGCLTASAAGSQESKLKVGFEPNRLGSSTTLEFGFTIDMLTMRSPLIGVSLHFPEGIAYATSTLGAAECDPHLLAQDGARGCPTNSRIGSGTAQVTVPFGSSTLTEAVKLTMFVGRTEGEQVEVLYSVIGTTPVIAQLVFPGELVSESVGGSINTSLPLISTLPEATDASVVSFQSQIGPKNLLYTAVFHGRHVTYHPRGIVLPSFCPRGGFVFSATFHFQDGENTNARSIVDCPHARHHRR